MKKNTSNKLEAEAAFGTDIYQERAAVNRKVQEVLASGSRSVWLTTNLRVRGGRLKPKA
jgi:hypothetical protein